MQREGNDDMVFTPGNKFSERGDSSRIDLTDSKNQSQSNFTQT